MRVHSKMMVSSSPGRPEKLVAPPFTKLLRGKGGSRSRGRSLSRSSPMFVIRRRSNGSSSTAAEIQDAKDPGSPKVTCIGQVRIKKKKKMNKNNKQIESSTRNQESKVKEKDEHWICFGCFQTNGMLFHPFSKAVKTRVWTSWRRWLLCSCSRIDQNKISKEEDARGGDLGNGSLGLDRFVWRREDMEGEVVKKEDVEVVVEKEAFVPTEPPKNALLLMRCRSAPHRSAAITAALSEEKVDDPVGNLAGQDKKEQQQIDNNLVSKEEGSCSCDESSREDDEEDETATAAVGPSPSFSSRPLILTRCKSEPAKKTAGLAVVESSSCFWGSGNGGNSSGKNKKWLALVDESFPK